MATSDGYIQLLNAQTTNVTTSGVQLNYGKSSACVEVWGTWNGATVTLQIATQPVSGVTTWITIADRFNIAFNFTADTSIALVDFVYNQYVRAVVTNAGASTNLNCIIRPI